MELDSCIIISKISNFGCLWEEKWKATHGADGGVGGHTVTFMHRRSVGWYDFRVGKFCPSV